MGPVTAMPTFDTAQPITATIDLGAGAVRIVASERATTAIDVRPSDASNEEDRKVSELTRVEYADGRLLVKAPRQRNWLSRSGGGSIDVTIELPAGSDVHGNGAAADFDCDGPIGECRIKSGLGHIRVDEAGRLAVRSGLGDISVERVTGAADITTGSGDVRAHELEGTAVVRNSNGATWIGVAGADLRVNAANGGVAVDVARSTVVAKSANGDITLREVTRGTVVLETRLGHLEVGIPEGTAAFLDVRSSAGRLYNSLEASEAPEGPAETVEVRGRTSAGDIVIRRP